MPAPEAPAERSARRGKAACRSGSARSSCPSSRSPWWPRPAAATSRRTAGDSGGNEDCTSEIRVGIALDVGGLGDKSFNDAAKAGLDQAIADGQVCEENANFVEANNTGSNRDANIEALADEGYDLVIGVGFAFSAGCRGHRADYPDVNFAIVDGFATFLPDAKGSDQRRRPHLQGAGGVIPGGRGRRAQVPVRHDRLPGWAEGTGLIEKFEAGYTAGAKAVNPDIDVLVEYIGDDTTAFVNDVKGEALSAKMYDGGAEHRLPRRRPVRSGALHAPPSTRTSSRSASDSDQYLTAAPEEQPVDPHVHAQARGHGRVRRHRADRRRRVQGWVPGVRPRRRRRGLLHVQRGRAHRHDIVEQMDEFKEQIISGEIVVPEEPENA